MEIHAPEPEHFGLNVGAFENAFPCWRLSAAFDGQGFAARRVINGRRAGPAVTAMTLDELAAKLPEAPAPGQRPRRLGPARALEVTNDRASHARHPAGGCPVPFR